MVVGVCHLDLILPDVLSLKRKRQILKSLMARVRDKFDVSVSEVGAHDLWQRAHVGICVVGNDKKFVNSYLDKVIDYVDRTELVDVVRSEMELLHFNYDEV